MKEKDKKEGLLKRLKHIEDKNEERLKTTKNKTKNIKQITNFFEERLSLEAKALFEEIKTIEKNVDYKKLVLRIRMILEILKHLMIYLETFILKK